jgi:predicted secreted Zn-dependent protease
MASKGKCTVKMEKPKEAAYKVSGKTLAEIWEDIQKKGPKDGGQARAGHTSAEYDSPAKSDFDGETTPKEKNAPEYEAKVWFKDAGITVDTTIRLPALDSDKDLSDAAKKEWARFMKDLRAHEDEHVAATQSALEAAAKEIGKIEGTGKGKDKKAAIKAAQEDHADKMKAFDKAKLEKTVKDANKELDTGGHGPTLRTSIT